MNIEKIVNNYLDQYVNELKQLENQSVSPYEIGKADGKIEAMFDLKQVFKKIHKGVKNGSRKRRHSSNFRI